MTDEHASSIKFDTTSRRTVLKGSAAAAGVLSQPRCSPRFCLGAGEEKAKPHFFYAESTGIVGFS